MNKGLYVHIPFCIKKCLYCDFFSKTDFTLKEAYVKALLKEYDKYKNETFDTVFIGGGTPSSLGDLLVEICKSLPKADEFTVEVNPKTVDYEMLRSMKNAGVNRLSIGVQSFNDEELRALGRIHSAKDAIDTYESARRAGFENISIDLMLSIPNQTLCSVKNNLETVKRLNPEHVSAYSLIVEEGTPFYDMDLELPGEDEEREIYYTVCEFLGKMGLRQYEISNFAKKGYESKHNIKYWTNKPYIGIGAGASSYNNGFRYRNKADIEAYINGRGYGIDREEVTKEEQCREKFWLGLRMTDGVEYFGEFPDIVNNLTEKNLLMLNGSCLKLTKKGIDLGNVVFSEFV